MATQPTPTYETILKNQGFGDGKGRAIQLFQLYDLVAEQVVGPIIPCPHQAPAVRHFIDLLKDKNTTVAAHPADYALLYIGMQEETTGVLIPLNNPVAALTGAAWLATQTSE